MARVATSVASSRGWLKCAITATLRPDATTCANSRSRSSASLSETNRYGQ